MLIGLLALFKELFFFAAYVSSGNSFPDPLPPAEEAIALEKLRDGDPQARDTLIRHNLRLVAHIAKKYSAQGQDVDDLISIGTIGLIKAVSTFDCCKGAQLATYAARCIQNEILMTVRASKKLKSDVSLGDPIGIDKEGNEITLVDVMGTLPGAVIDEVERKMQVEQLRCIICKCLTTRERLVVELRYGLTRCVCLPQREVAKLLGISRSYVSRIEKKALTKLKVAFENC